MTAKRIPQLDAIAGSSTANDDNLVIFDTDANTTKRILRSQLAAGLVGDLPYTPAGGISATTVVSAIAELDSEAAKSATLAAAAGASLVGYLPAQSGASSTTVQDTLRLNFNPGNATAVAGVSMKIDALMEAATPTFPLKDEAGIWPSGIVHSFAGISKEFTSAMGGVGTPSTTLCSYAVNNNSPGDICAGLFVAVANTNSDTVFGLNIIARNSTGTTGTKLVGLEIDVEPAVGTTVASGGAGMYINAFNVAMSVPAIQIGTVGGGTFNNGLILGGLSTTATGVAPGASATMDSLINTGTGVFTTAAALFSNTHKIRFAGTAAAHAFIYNDSSNNLRIVNAGGATVFRNNADTVSNVTINDTGIVQLGATGTINFDVAQTTTTVGAAGAAAAPPATPTGYVTIQISGVTRKIPFYEV